MVAFGYRENEIPQLPRLVGDKFHVVRGDSIEQIGIDPTFEIKSFRPRFDRPVVAASLGMHVPGVCLPHPDPGHSATIMAGSMYRFCRDIPYKDVQMRDRFKIFVEEWLVKNLQPLPYDSDVTVESWLEKCPYSLGRKKELYGKYIQSGLGLDKPIPRRVLRKILRVKSFMKDEHYPDWKHARAINSRTDEFKCLVGPIFQLISEKLFSLPWFIKKIPIADRPQYIIDLLYRVGKKYLISDYTSFEAHFTKEMQERCELQLYRHMVAFLPNGAVWFDLINQAKTGDNEIRFKDIAMKIQAKRMSGEMDTSCSNGFSNLMFMLFLCREAGIDIVDGVIEGDDGLFVFDGTLSPQLFNSLGLSVKIGEVSELSHASFCGMVFDLEDRTNVTNPIEELVSFGWTRSRYAGSKHRVLKCLLRAKALSLAYQYPACPILSKLAYKVCQLTAGYDSLTYLEKQGRNMVDGYYVQVLKEAHEYFDKNKLLREPGMNTRLLVEELYGITVQDQLIIEKSIDDMVEIGPLACPVILNYVSQSWIDYFERYCLSVNIKIMKTDQYNYSGFRWPAPNPETDFSGFLKNP